MQTNMKNGWYFVSSFIFCFTGHLKELQTFIGSALKFNNYELYLNRNYLLLCSLLALAAGEKTYHGYTVSENSKYICSMHISIKWKQLCEDLQAPDVQEDYETSSVRLCNVNFSNVLFSEKRQNLMRPKMQFSNPFLYKKLLLFSLFCIIVCARTSRVEMIIKVLTRENQNKITRCWERRNWTLPHQNW